MSQYFKGIKDATKTLATGLKVTMKEYFTPKSTEQYPREPQDHTPCLGASPRSSRVQACGRPQ